MTYKVVPKMKHEDFVREVALLRGTREAISPSTGKDNADTAFVEAFQRKLGFLRITIDTHSAVQAGRTRIPLPPATRTAKLIDLEKIIRLKWDELLAMSNANHDAIMRELLQTLTGR